MLVGGFVCGVRKLLGDNLKVDYGKFFNSKLCSFAKLHSKCTICIQPHLELKTQHKFSLGNKRFSILSVMGITQWSE